MVQRGDATEVTRAPGLYGRWGLWPLGEPREPVAYLFDWRKTFSSFCTIEERFPGGSPTPQMRMRRHSRRESQSLVERQLHRRELPKAGPLDVQYAATPGKAGERDSMIRRFTATPRANGERQ